MTETYPVSLAIRAVERAIRRCDAPLTDKKMDAIDAAVGLTRDEWSFIATSRASLRASLELVLAQLQRDYDGLHYGGYVYCGTLEYRAVVPLIEHFDATEPGWRDEQ